MTQEQVDQLINSIKSAQKDAASIDRAINYLAACSGDFSDQQLLILLLRQFPGIKIESIVRRMLLKQKLFESLSIIHAIVNEFSAYRVILNDVFRAHLDDRQFVSIFIDVCPFLDSASRQEIAEEWLSRYGDQEASRELIGSLIINDSNKSLKYIVLKWLKQKKCYDFLPFIISEYADSELLEFSKNVLRDNKSSSCYASIMASMIRTYKSSDLNSMGIAWLGDRANEPDSGDVIAALMETGSDLLETALKWYQFNQSCQSADLVLAQIFRTCQNENVISLVLSHIDAESDGKSVCFLIDFCLNILVDERFVQIGLDWVVKHNYGSKNIEERLAVLNTLITYFPHSKELVAQRKELQ